MADLGSLVLVDIPEPMVIDSWSTTADPVEYTQPIVLAETPISMEIANYKIGGTLIQQVTLGVPNWGQLWPRGDYSGNS